MIPLLIAGCAGVAAGASIFSALRYFDMISRADEDPFWDRVVVPFMTRVISIITRITPSFRLQTIRTKSKSLDIKINAGLFVSLQLLLAMIVFGLLHIVSVNVWLALVAAAIVYYTPEFIINMMINSRNTSILLELPNFLDLVIVHIEAGLGFDSALDEISQTRHGPLYVEFGKALREMQHGSSRRAAMINILERARVSQLSRFIKSFLQADELGVSIRDLLDIQSNKLRSERRQRAEQIAQAAPIKISVVLAFFILPVILIVVFGAAVPKILQAFGS